MGHGSPDCTCNNQNAMWKSNHNPATLHEKHLGQQGALLPHMLPYLPGLHPYVECRLHMHRLHIVKSCAMLAKGSRV